MINISLGIDGELFATIPSSIPGREQHISIPLSLDGLRILRRILISRERPAKLGEPGEPTQSLVTEWLRAERARELQATAQSVEDLGLEIEI